MCEALIYLLDNIYISVGTKLYRQIVGISMGTTCTPLVADLFLFYYERAFMTSLSDVKQAEIIEALNATFAFIYFKRICPSKIYDRRDDFDFDIVSLPFFDGDVPRFTSYGAYISPLIRFATKFYRRHYELVSKFIVWL